MTTEFSGLIWLDEQHEVSLHELTTLSGLTLPELKQLVENGVLRPNNPHADEMRSEDWQFNSHYLVLIRTLSRLKQDFELESNALGLTLVFLERIRSLEQQLIAAVDANSTELAQ
jgi:chaperone modulatory protein CbpM